MGCFCHQSVAALQQKLQRLESTEPAGSTSGSDAAGTSPREAQQAQEVATAASALTTRGLPAPPWQPDPKWLDHELPTPQLAPEALATITALATLRHQAQTALGSDPLEPEQAKPLKRMVATMNQRLTDLAKAPPPPDPAPWHRLAAQSEAADTVQEAAKSGLLDPSPEQVEAYSQPAGRPMKQWLALLRNVRALAPLIAAANQMGQSLEDPQTLTQRLADAVRKMRGLDLPPPVQSAQAARLMSLMSANARLRQSLGVDPTEAGYAAVQKAVAAKTAAAATMLRQIRAKQKQPPPNLPYCPTLLATPDVIKAATSDGGRQLAALGWKVPPASTLPALQSGLQASTLAKQMAAVLGGSPVRQAPCGQGCDAARIMRTVD